MFITTLTARTFFDMMGGYGFKMDADYYTSGAIGLANIMLENSGIPLKFRKVFLGEVRANSTLRSLVRYSC